MASSKVNTTAAIFLLAITLFASAANASPTVSGNVISWTEEGWHQVQLQSTYESVCNGGRQCTLPAGVYTVINHGTGERFPNIAVPGDAAGDNKSPPAPVASTGQVISYAFGDDGDFQTGTSVPDDRFQDNEDGTFRDTLTGITWLGVADCIVEKTWGPAIDYANTLSANSDMCPDLNDESIAGDWRLPTIKELYSLIDVSDYLPALTRDLPIIDQLSGLAGGNFYWSSTSFKPIPDINAFVLDSGFGLVASWTKTENAFYAWPVRVER